MKDLEFWKCVIDGWEITTIMGQTADDFIMNRKTAKIEYFKNNKIFHIELNKNANALGEEFFTETFHRTNIKDYEDNKSR